MNFAPDPSAVRGHIAEPANLLVADSFRIRARGNTAQGRGFSLHLDRFRASALQVSTELEFPKSFAVRLETFLTVASGRIAADGEGFPRLELWSSADGTNPNLTLALRPLPPGARDLDSVLGTPVEVRSVDSSLVPKLAHPERKGPGIGAFASLSAELGAEPLFLDPDGGIVEGGTTSLLWWEGDEARIVASTARVDSITERLVTGLLVDAGVPVRAASATLAQVTNTEVWALNALHGIRSIRAIDGRVLPGTDSARFAHVRASLDHCWLPIS